MTPQTQANKIEFKKISELCDLRKGKKVNSTKTKTKNSIPYLLIDTLRGAEPEFFTEDKNYTEAIPEDILIVADGANSGLVGTGVKGAVGSTILRIRINVDDLNKDYLSYFLKSKFTEFNKDMKGTGIPHLKAQKMMELELRKPSPETQSLIVSAIETQFTRLDSAVKSLKSIKAKLEVYRKAVLKKAFEKIDKKVLLKEVAKVISGFAFKSSDFVQKKETPLIKITNIGYGSFIEDDKDYLPTNFKEEYRNFLVYPGTMLLTLTRPITNNKVKVCIYPEDKKESLLNQRVAMILNNSSIEKDFLLYFMFSEDFKLQLRKNMSETLQPNLSPVKLSTFSIPLPSPQEQSQIVSAIEAKFSVIDKVEEIVNNSLKKAEMLRKSILKSAFEGKLVGEE
jgi:type I restriction enzyme, S subunit